MLRFKILNFWRTKDVDLVNYFGEFSEVNANSTILGSEYNDSFASLQKTKDNSHFLQNI